MNPEIVEGFTQNVLEDATPRTRIPPEIVYRGELSPLDSAKYGYGDCKDLVSSDNQILIIVKGEFTSKSVFGLDDDTKFSYMYYLLAHGEMIKGSNINDDFAKQQVENLLNGKYTYPNMCE